MGVEDDLRNIAGTLLRFTAFSSHAFLFGLVPVLVLVLRPIFRSLPDDWTTGRARVGRRLEGLVRACLVSSAVSTILILLLQVSLVANLDTGAMSEDALSSVLSTSFGQWHLVRLPLVAGLAVLLVGRVRSWALATSAEEGGASSLWWGAWTAVSLALLATTTFSGHSRVATPQPVALSNDVLHLASGAVWFAGIIVLAVVLPDAWRKRAKPERLAVLAPAVSRFSKVALVSIAIVAITGTINSFLHLGNFADFWETTYGEALALKILLFLGILALGAVNHFFVRKQLEKAQAEGTETESSSTFRRTIAVELIIALVLMTATGLLVGLARTKRIPPRTDTSGTVTTGP